MFLGVFIVCLMGMNRAEESQGTLPGAPRNGSLPTASQTRPKPQLPVLPVRVHLPGKQESPHAPPPPDPWVVQRLLGNNHNPALLSMPRMSCPGSVPMAGVGNQLQGLQQLSRPAWGAEAMADQGSGEPTSVLLSWSWCSADNLAPQCRGAEELGSGL